MLLCNFRDDLFQYADLRIHEFGWRCPDTIQVTSDGRRSGPEKEQAIRRS